MKNRSGGGTDGATEAARFIERYERDAERLTGDANLNVRMPAASGWWRPSMVSPAVRSSRPVLKR